MLIDSPRLTDKDRAYWTSLEQRDALYAKLPSLQKKQDKAAQAIKDFAANECYASISWGKDSTVVAHLIVTTMPGVPLIWAKVIPIFNPECEDVRDIFLKQHPYARYEEVCIEAPLVEGKVKASRTLEKAFSQVEEKYGKRRITGIRGEESGIRKMRQKIHGIASPFTLAPITYWSTRDVFAYLYKQDLPVHPAYAMTKGGLLDRDFIRVASIGGQRGVNMGRREWESIYYPELVEINN